MQRIPSPAGVTVSYDNYGEGPPLVLVHGSFSDHKTNWEFVKPVFETQFTVYAIARRGRGETDSTKGHSLEDESRDVVAVIRSIGEPVFLLGHSYGAQTALAAAAQVPDRVRKLVLYEPASPRIVEKEALGRSRSLGSHITITSIASERRETHGPLIHRLWRQFFTFNDQRRAPIQEGRRRCGVY